MAFGNRNVLNLLYTLFKASFSFNKYFGYENILHCLLYPLKMVVVKKKKKGGMERWLRG